MGFRHRCYTLINDVLILSLLIEYVLDSLRLELLPRLTRLGHSVPVNDSLTGDSFHL